MAPEIKKQEYENLVNVSPYGIVVLGQDGRILYCNKAMQDLAGKKIETGATIEDWAIDAIPDNKKRATFLQAWSDETAMQNGVAHELLLTRADGKRYWCSFETRKLEDGNFAIYGRDISSRMKIRSFLNGATRQLQLSEEYLRASEEKFHNIFQSIHIGLHMYTVSDSGDLIFTGANVAADKILGIKHEQLIGKTIQEAFPSQAEGTIPKRYKQVAATGKSWHSEQVEYEDEQISGVFEVNAFRTGPGQMVAAFQDITQRKRTEAELIASEERYRSFAEGFHGIAFCATLDLVPVFVHGAVEELSGYTAEDFFSGRCKWAELIHPDDRERQMELVKELATVPNSLLESEYRAIRKDGRVVWINGVSRNICDKSGKPVQIEGTMIDITRRRNAEEETLRLAAAVSGAAESIVITDEKGTIQYVNPWFERMTGYLRSETVGKNTSILGSGKHDRAFYDRLWSTLNAGRTWRGHFINKKKDGTLFEENAVISPVRDQSGKVVSYVAVKRDVTQERELEGQIRQSQKMAAIGQLAHRIAHDFTNVLVMILGNAQLARAKAQTDSELVQYIDEVIASANRVSALTAELLAFAHPAPLISKVVKLRVALSGIGEILNRTIGREVELSINTEEAICKVNIDVAQIEQAIVHLVINACDAMPKGGKLSVFAGPADLTPEEEILIQIGVTEENRCASGFAVISVSDTGFGMTQEVATRAFEPFFSTKKTKENAGLGLSTVYAIVKQHNGHVTIDSQPGHGTVVKIFLPVVS